MEIGLDLFKCLICIDYQVRSFIKLTKPKPAEPKLTKPKSKALAFFKHFFIISQCL